MNQSMIIQSASFDEAEIEVSDILLNLKSLIQESEYRSLVPPLTWSSKRRRSDINLGLNSPCSSPISVSQVEGESDNVEVELKSIKFKSEATSPDTPLSFPPSENDDKLSKKSMGTRKTREELMKNIEKLTKCREVLRGEVEKVRSYYDSQKAYNLVLKAMRERVMTNLNEQGPRISLGQHLGSSTVQPHRQHPFIVDQTFQYPMGQLLQAQPMLSSAIGLGSMNSQSPFEHNRDIAERKAQFAEVRRKRRMKRIETKRSSGLIKTTKERDN